MDLPLDIKDLDKIINLLKNTYPELYAKLWAYKINYLNREKNDGLS
jgi:hypothetical protein